MGDWPEGRGIFHNKDKTFLTWVNEEDQLRIISMQMGGDVKGVFDRLARGINAVGESVKKESGKDFMLDPKYGFIHSCPTNLGTGMRASVHVDLPGYTKEGLAVQSQMRGAEGSAKGNQGRVWWTDRHHLRYFQQASSWVFRGRVGAVHDRRCEHFGGRGQGTAEEARDRLILLVGG